MQKFSDVLLTLDSADDVQRIELYNENGKPAGSSKTSLAVRVRLKFTITSIKCMATLR